MVKEKAPARAGQVQGEEEEIDFNAALSSQPAKRRGRPPGEPIITNNNKDILLDNIDDVGTESIYLLNIEKPVSLKDAMTEKELKFLAFFLSGQYNREKAMELAGYTNITPNYRYLLAKKIIEKYESQAEDHRKIFRALGAGEVAVVRGLLDLAKNAGSEMVRLNAWLGIAKCLGLSKEILEGAGGLTIIFEAPDGAQVERVPGPPPPGPVTSALPGGKPLMITK